MNVNGTGTGSASTLNGDAGNDVFNVRGMNGTVNVNGGADDDSINVGSDAPALPSTPTNQLGTIDSINGLLVVNGGGGTDALNVDDSDPAVNNKSGTLTASTLRGLELEQGINYSQMETLSIWLAAGDNIFTDLQHPCRKHNRQCRPGQRHRQRGWRQRQLDHQCRSGQRHRQRARHWPAQRDPHLRPGRRRHHQPQRRYRRNHRRHRRPDRDRRWRRHRRDQRRRLRQRDQQGRHFDVGTLRGLELEAGVNYSGAEDFNLWLGTGTDGLFIASTHGGTTDIYAGDGNSTVNQRDDTIAIKSISGVTTVHGQGGNDFVYVNVDAPSGAANDASFFAQFKNAAAAAANEAVFNTLFSRTNANQIGAVLNLHGEGDSDQYTRELRRPRAGAGQRARQRRARRWRRHPDRQRRRDVEPTPSCCAGPSSRCSTTSNNDGAFDQVERVNYDENINARLIVNGLGGDDMFVADDNSAITTLDGGDGNDTFQIGQVFGTLRDAAAGVAAGGYVRHHAGHRRRHQGSRHQRRSSSIPTSFDPVTDELSQPTIDAINAAILHQATWAWRWTASPT